jgi:hypothetical protein
VVCCLFFSACTRAFSWRLLRARQEIEDILNMAKGVKIGLVAFAADPHMITND